MAVTLLTKKKQVVVGIVEAFIAVVSQSLFIQSEIFLLKCKKTATTSVTILGQNCFVI